MLKQSRKIQRVVHAARERYQLDLHGIHGPSHWQRVRDNGLRIAKSTGADTHLVELFAFLHDCCREDDGADLDHGPRAAAFIETLRDNVLDLGDDDFRTLQTAIREHTTGRHTDNVTVATCWDADRLDIGRVGGRPHARYLVTDAAKDETTIQWAYERSRAYWR